MDGRLRKLLPREEEVPLTRSVQLGKLEGHALIHVLVEGPQGEDRHGRVDHVVDRHEERIENRLVSGCKVERGRERKDLMTSQILRMTSRVRGTRRMLTCTLFIEQIKGQLSTLIPKDLNRL